MAASAPEVMTLRSFSHVIFHESSPESPSASNVKFAQATGLMADLLSVDALDLFESVVFADLADLLDLAEKTDQELLSSLVALLRSGKSSVG